MTTPRLEAFQEYAVYRQNCINIAQAIRDRTIAAANERFEQDQAAALANETQAREWYDSEHTSIPDVKQP